jgi:hypothetical protein
MAYQSENRDHHYGHRKVSNPKLANRQYRDANLDYGDGGSSRHSSEKRSRIKKKVPKPQYEEPHTEQLDEGERMSLVAKLEGRKKDIWALIQRLPICQRTSAVEQREKELYNSLDEVTVQLNMLNNNKIMIM